MAEFITEFNFPIKLAQLNDICLYLKIYCISDSATNNGTQIHQWTLYGPPAQTSLQWPKRRPLLECNMKLWRRTIRKVFLGGNSLYLNPLGDIIPDKMPRPMIRDILSYNVVL